MKMIAKDLGDMIGRLDSPGSRKFIRPTEALHELKTLYYISTDSGLHQRGIACKLKISLGHANEVLRRLKEKRYIRYSPNTHSTFYELTRSGEAHLDSESHQLKEATGLLGIQDKSYIDA